MIKKTIIMFLLILLSKFLFAQIDTLSFSGSAKNLISIIANKHNLNVLFDITAYSHSNDFIMLNFNNIAAIDAVKLAAKTANFTLTEIDGIIHISYEKEIKEEITEEDLLVRYFHLNYIEANAVKSLIEALMPTRNFRMHVLHFDEDIIAPGGSGGSGGIEETLGRISKSSKTSNAIVVKGKLVDIARVRKIIDEVDIKPDQVLLQVVITELSTDATKNLGIKWTAEGQMRFSEGELTRDLKIENPTSDNPVLVGRLLSGNLSAVLTAIESDRNSEILSRPWITTLNNELAQIKVTEKLPYVSSYTVTGTGVDRISKPEVEVEEFGIKLSVLPRITNNKNIFLEIYPSITDFIRFETFGTGNEQVKLPRISIREAYTKVLVQNNETIVIGGLKTKRNLDRQERLPFLSKIPLLGRLFRHSDRDNAFSELIMFITPILIEDNTDWETVYNREKIKQGDIND